MPMSPYVYPGIKTALLDDRDFIKVVDFNFIIGQVSEYYDISVERIMSKTRKEEVVHAREVLAFLLRKYTRLTFKSIGDLMGGKHHSSVMHEVQRLKDLMVVDKTVETQIKSIAERLIV